jgi:hypothetical protein
MALGGFTPMQKDIKARAAVHTFPRGCRPIVVQQFVHVLTNLEPTERPEDRGYSWLKPDVENH